MRLRRIIPRFSLRTLVVFLLLVTAATGLWWHWGPWYCGISIELPSPREVCWAVNRVRYIDSARRLEVARVEMAIKSIEDFFPAEVTLDTYVYDPETGRRMGTTSVAISSKALASLSVPDKIDCVTSDGSRRLEEQQGRISSLILVCDTRNENVLAELGPFHVGGNLGLASLDISPDGNGLVIATSRPENRAHIYRRRRPE